VVCAACTGSAIGHIACIGLGIIHEFREGMKPTPRVGRRCLSVVRRLRVRDRTWPGMRRSR
jgi:hypothetical protein